MKYAISNWIYGDEPVEETFARLKRCGYDGVELMGEPDQYDPEAINKLCDSYGLKVLSIAGMYPWPTDSRDLANPDPAIRERAVDYLIKCVHFATQVGAPLIIVVPAAVGRVSPLGGESDDEHWVAGVEREWENAVSSVKQAAVVAEEKGVFLAIEPINRYETFLVTNVDDALRFVRDVGSSAVKIHLDTFHMNIEESDPADAIRRAGDLLVNVHISDSNREAVGRGHFDFRGLMKALKDIGYRGTLALEPLPPVPNPYIAARMKRFAHLKDVYAGESVDRLKELEVVVAEG
jgi:D-psicose/D-tagatose/L-ribulose 3-epimerase